MHDRRVRAYVRTHFAEKLKQKGKNHSGIDCALWYFSLNILGEVNDAEASA